MSLGAPSEASNPDSAIILPKPSEDGSSISEPPGPSTAVLRSLSDPLPALPIIKAHPKQSASSLQTFDDAASRAVCKYPRFSTATTLAETGGPGFSMEELTSTEVSEDEDAIINEPVLRRRRALSRLSLQPPSAHTVPLAPISQQDRLQRATHYIRELLTSFVHAIINYVTAAHDQEATAEGTRDDEPSRRAGEAVSTPSSSK